jgi:hypothetical protein
MTILQLQVAESSIAQQGDLCLKTTKIDQSNRENEGTMQGEKKGEKTKKVTTKKKREKKVDNNPEPPYVKSDYKLYVEEKRKRNAEHMRQWNLNAAQAKQVSLQQEINIPETKSYDTKTQSCTSDNTDNQRITNGDLPVALDFTTDMPTAADITTEVGIKQLVRTMEGASNQGTNQKGATATNPSISTEVNVEQYRDNENWTVDFFVSHMPRTFDILFNKNRTKCSGYILLTRWKGYDPADDTLEPMHLAVIHHTTQLLAYLKEPNNKEFLLHIHNNKYNRFNKDFLAAIMEILEK